MLTKAKTNERYQTMAKNYRQRVENYFETTASFWKDVYGQNGVHGALYRQRRDLIDEYVKSLHLPAESHFLEVGCGAGFTSVNLARNGYRVTAVDVVEAMVDSVQKLAAEANVANRITARVGDVHRLDFPDNTFDVVIAIGVLEWVPALHQPLAELTRVLRPGGYLIVNVDNAWAIHRVLDPLKFPVLTPAKRIIRNMLEKIGAIKPIACSNRCSIRKLNAAIAAAGLQKIQGATCAFGPFTFLGRTVLPDRLGVSVHHFLQRLADKNIPVVRIAGEVYLVLAQK